MRERDELRGRKLERKSTERERESKRFREKMREITS